MRALLALALLGGWSAPAFAACTWDPAQINSNITLSNTNHTWTSTNTNNGLGRATTGYLAGTGSTNASYKLYFEVTATSAAGGNLWGVGVDALGDNVANFVGASFAGVGLYTGGHVATNGATGATYFSFATAAVIGVAVDFFHQKLWWTQNGTTWNNDIIANQNPATNVGGFGTFNPPGPFGGGGLAYSVVYPAFGTQLTTGNAGTYNGGDSAFAYTTPSGFAAWCGAPLTSTPQLFRVSP